MGKYIVSMLSTMAILIISSATSLADTTLNLNKPAMNKTSIWEVDYRARPPFKRRSVEVADAKETSEVKTQDKSAQNKTSWEVDYSGRPPFKRRSKVSHH